MKIGQKIKYFETISSTNEYLKENNNEHGFVVVSNEQSKGKGRLGRVWNSNKNDGLYISILLKPSIEIQRIPFITIIAGSSIIKALNNLNIEANIKWPNDIIINNKKIGGILSELIIKNNEKNVIVGIGINIKARRFDDELKEKATSIENEGYEVLKEDLIKNILEEFNKLYCEYVDNFDVKTIIDIHRKNSAIINKNIYVINKDKKELMKYVDINENGNLLVKNNLGEIKEISSGEVSIRGENGYI